MFFFHKKRTYKQQRPENQTFTKKALIKSGLLFANSILLLETDFADNNRSLAYLKLR